MKPLFIPKTVNFWPKTGHFFLEAQALKLATLNLVHNLSVGSSLLRNEL